MRTKLLFLILALLCTIAQGAWAQASWEEVYTMTNTTAANWTQLNAGSTTGQTLGTAGTTTYYYADTDLTFSNSTAGGSGLTILGTVYLYVPQGVTVTCTGADASGQTGAGAGIELAAGNALCLIGQGEVSATGGNAANGSDGTNGSDANWDSSNYWSGTGGTGGHGGGGAGAGIGTRGGDGGQGGAGADRVITKWKAADGGSGAAGQAGATAGAMGELYKTYSFGSLTATGGAAASQGGSAGGAGKSAFYDDIGYNYTVAGGGGGGGGGFGGAASNIGTGGPGGGGGGGGASGNLDWSTEPGYYVVKAPGGKGGQNGDGTWAAAGAESIMNHNAIKTGQVKINASGWEDDKWNYDSYTSPKAVGTSGSGGAKGTASTSDQATTIDMKPLTKDEWDIICQQTQTSQSQWMALPLNVITGGTIGAAGTTTYYFATVDRSFTNSTAGGSGLTIQGTVYLFIASGNQITCKGGDASGTTGAGAGIELTEGNTLHLLGSGTLNATGGNASKGYFGSNGSDADFMFRVYCQPGSGGRGGNGGGGAGAGIGTRGGQGGIGGAGGIARRDSRQGVNLGVAGTAGSDGSSADPMGTLHAASDITLNVKGGNAGTSGGGGSRGKNAAENTLYHISASGGGGGGGGGFGGSAAGIGTGGPGGGGGGGGAAGNSNWGSKASGYGFFRVGAGGGAGGRNGDGATSAYGGTTSVLGDARYADLKGGISSDVDTFDRGWEPGNEMYPGGSGGAAGAVSLALWPFSGEGAADSPYLISNEHEWNTFANNVSLGSDYSGQYVKLAADISVTQKCGTVSGETLTNAFSGTFDGDGHIISATITDTDNQGTALFSYINGATIKNLKVAGNITGGMHAAAIVGFSKGSSKNVIEGCVATANVRGGTHIGGILGYGLDSDIAISACVFSGTMTGGAEAKGAIFGWGDEGGTMSVTDCLYLMANGQNTANLDLVRMNGGTVEVTNCYKTISVGTYGTHCIFTTTAPSQLGNLVHDYGLVKAYEKGLFWEGKYYISPTTSTKAGTAGDPYIIANEADWASFAQWIKEKGDGFTGEYVQLTADITVSTPAGTSEAPFSGTFLGNGHTITANISDTGSGGTALFRNIKGATIKDLTVAGTITGGLHAAAIVGFAQGTGNSIRNCVVTANVSGGTHIGGILGHGLDSGIAISGCVFSGTMTGGGTAKGAIVGWGESDGTKTVTDCLYLMADGQNTGGLDLVRMNGGTVSVENSYKTTSAGSYGTQCVVTSTVPFDLGTLKQDYGIRVKAYDNGICYDGTYYMLPATLSGSGTEDDPYLIRSVYEWDSFVLNVNKGTTYSGQYVKLTEDISVTTMAGTRINDDDNKPFSGTFLGNGHTITANISDTNNQATALFRYINGATIKDLTVAGTVTSSQRHVSGLVGFAKGTNVIEGCVVTATLNINTDYAGGIVGHGIDSKTTISGCVFAGTMKSSSNPNVGVIWGWSNSGVPTLENCLEAGTYEDIDRLHPMGLQGNTGTITNCYYLTPQTGTPQNACTVSGARQSFPATVEPANLGDLVQDYGMVTAYQNGILYHGTYYAVPATITLADNADNGTTLNENDGYMANVTLQDRTFYRDGAWDTLCLPFSVASFTGTPLEGATVKTLASTSFEDGTLTMNFSDDVTSIEAGKPYIVMWAAGTENIVDPVFPGAVISNVAANVETDYVDFVGTYSPAGIYTDEKTNLYFGDGNTLYYPTDEGFTVNACRAYFQLKQGLTAGEASPNPSEGGGVTVRAFVLNFGDGEGNDNNASGIITTNVTNSTNSGNEWYTLDGRKLGGKPTQRGIYVNNGRKVVIK